MVFFPKNILIPNVAEKNILILVEEKNNNMIQSFYHITCKPCHVVADKFPNCLNTYIMCISVTTNFHI
jgi:hypothetical protein